VPPKVLGSD